MTILVVDDIFYDVEWVRGFEFTNQRLHDIGIDREEVQSIVDDNVKLDIRDRTCLAKETIVDAILIGHVHVEWGHITDSWEVVERRRVYITTIDVGIGEIFPPSSNARSRDIVASTFHITGNAGVDRSNANLQYIQWQVPFALEQMMVETCVVMVTAAFVGAMTVHDFA